MAYKLYLAKMCACTSIGATAVRFEVIPVVMKRWPPRGYDGGVRSREKLYQQRVCNVPVITEPLVALVREVKYKSQAIVNNVLGQTFVAQATTFTEFDGWVRSPAPYKMLCGIAVRTVLVWVRRPRGRDLRAHVEFHDSRTFFLGGFAVSPKTARMVP